MKQQAALIDPKEKVIIILAGNDLKERMHAIQCYGERFLNELLIRGSAPGEIELNPYWTWKFLLDKGLYEVDIDFIPIPMYKDQQH